MTRLPVIVLAKTWLKAKYVTTSIAPAAAVRTTVTALSVRGRRSGSSIRNAHRRWRRSLTNSLPAWGVRVRLLGRPAQRDSAHGRTLAQHDVDVHRRPVDRDPGGGRRRRTASAGRRDHQILPGAPAGTEGEAALVVGLRAVGRLRARGRRRASAQPPPARRRRQDAARDGDGARHEVARVLLPQRLAGRHLDPTGRPHRRFRAVEQRRDRGDEAADRGEAEREEQTVGEGTGDQLRKKLRPVRNPACCGPTWDSTPGPSSVSIGL